MYGTEYQRARLLVAAKLLRAAKVSSLVDLTVSYWREDRDHCIEILNTENSKSARLKVHSALDVPTYAEIVEAVMLRCRV